MWYKLGADLVLILHFTWIIFLLTGLPLGALFKSTMLRISHALAVVFTLIQQIVDYFCPLTIWEERLRTKFDPGFSYRGSFIKTYLDKLVYPDWISLKIIPVLTIILAVLTALSFKFYPIKIKRE